MIFIQKSNGSGLQPLLDAARLKDKADVYRSGSVYEKIKHDFFEKCYLCEDTEATSIQIEHFQPHQGDLAKKFDWENLFYACGHCNGIKGANYWPLLNCTNPADQVWASVEIFFNRFPKASVEIQLNPACPKPEAGENTRRLLEKTLAGKDATAMQRDQAANLRKKMLRVYTVLAEAIERNDMDVVQATIADSAPFAGMLRWCLKHEHPKLFEQVMPSTN